MWTSLVGAVLFLTGMCVKMFTLKEVRESLSITARREIDPSVIDKWKIRNVYRANPKICDQYFYHSPVVRLTFRIAVALMLVLYVIVLTQVSAVQEVGDAGGDQIDADAGSMWQVVLLKPDGKEAARVGVNGSVSEVLIASGGQLKSSPGFGLRELVSAIGLFGVLVSLVCLYFAGDIRTTEELRSES